MGFVGFLFVVGLWLCFFFFLRHETHARGNTNPCAMADIFIPERLLGRYFFLVESYVLPAILVMRDYSC